MDTVSSVEVKSYDPGLLRNAVDAHFSRLGLKEFISPDSKVLIKPNLLAAKKPDRCLTTHPAVIRAIAEALRDLGVENITVADSPGGPFVQTALGPLYSACGYKELEDVVRLNYETGFESVKCPVDGKVKSFDIIRPVIEADLIIDVAKLKTHTFTGMSGGIKNLFGCIPGLKKPEMHYRFPKLGEFSEMLLDLSKTVAPAVSFIDAVEGMEGDGPNMGTPKACGFLLASKNVYALDFVAAGIMGIPYEIVPMISMAEERGYFSHDEVEIIGDEPVCRNFVLPSTGDEELLNSAPSFMRGLLGAVSKNLLKPVPRIIRKTCLGCGKCAESCPQHIIEIKDRKARVKDRKKCISCFCCQEMCPAHSIIVKRRLR
ncbi:MAG: DUF362 domain-containing protein [Clostridia bacterium]|nr:DUF362 domain-containing protein [Clostridia bacterium]